MVAKKPLRPGPTLVVKNCDAYFSYENSVEIVYAVSIYEIFSYCFSSIIVALTTAVAVVGMPLILSG